MVRDPHGLLVRHVFFLHIRIALQVGAFSFFLYQLLGYLHRQIEQQDQVRSGKAEQVIINAIQPVLQSPTSLHVSHPRALMRDVGLRVAVRDHNRAFVEPVAYALTSEQPVSRIEKPHELRRDILQRPEVTTEECRDEPTILARVIRKFDVLDLSRRTRLFRSLERPDGILISRQVPLARAAKQRLHEHPALQGLSGAVRAFDDDEHDAQEMTGH